MEKGKRSGWYLTDISLIVFIFSKVGVFKGKVEYISLAFFVILIMIYVLEKKRFCLTEQIICYALFAMYASLSYFWAWNKAFALESLRNVVALLIFLMALSYYVNGKERLLKTMKYVVVANVTVSFKILIFYWMEAGSAATRIQAITGIHFNTVGQVVAFSILFSLYLYYACQDKRYLFFIAPQYMAVLLSSSRKSILIPILGIFLILLLKRDWRNIMVAILVMTAGGLLVGSAIRLTYPEMFQELFQKFVALGAYGRGIETDDWSINLRSFFFDTGKAIFKSHPLFGIGINNFAYYVGNYTSYTVERYSHNNYIELLSCMGVIGFSLYYLSYVYIFVKLAAYIRRDRKNMELIIALSVLIDLMIMEWGIVSYSGCLYHVYILLIYQTVRYRKKLQPEVHEKSG